MQKLLLYSLQYEVVLEGRISSPFRSILSRIGQVLLAFGLQPLKL